MISQAQIDDMLSRSNALVLGPNDVLVVQCPAEISKAEADAFADALRAALSDRICVLGGDLELAVLRNAVPVEHASAPGTAPLANAPGSE